MRACWLKWVGRDWSISADYIWLNYSGANSVSTFRCRGRWRDEPKSLRIALASCGHVLGRTHFRGAFGDGLIDACHGKLLLHFGLEMRGNQRQYVQFDSRRSASRIERTQWSICQNGMPRRPLHGNRHFFRAPCLWCVGESCLDGSFGHHALGAVLP